MDGGTEEKEKKLCSFVSNEDLSSKEISGSEKSLSTTSVVPSARTGSGSSSSNSSCKDDTCANSINNDTMSIHSPKNGRKKRPHNKFLGVRQRPSGRWVAEIKDASQKLRLWLGTFDSAEDAARAYDDAARFLRGENTRTNFAESKNCRNMQGRSSSTSKIARFLLLRHALAKNAEKNNSTAGKIHDVGATSSTQVTDFCDNTNTIKNMMTISNNGESAASANVCYNHFITNSKANTGMQLSQNLPFNNLCDPKVAITASATQTALFNNDPCNTFDRFWSSGWTLQLQEENHEQKRSFLHCSQLKAGSTVRVAPSFNASLYSEAEKWYQSLAAPLSLGHTSLL
ncbi:hypothetical protein SUGI_0576360 [Cryptomeria japonica]|nr:hypothetical protein SUGI_0576360 [Cryptomeria japonica]